MNFSQALALHLPEGRNLGDAPKGKSYDKAYQNQKPAGYNYKRESSGAGPDGLKTSTVKVPYYDIEKPKTVTKTVYKDRPAPKPAPTPKPKESIQHSPEIEQAKERVKSYENGKSPWEEAQANVQSSFIKDTATSSNQQYDFSNNTFDAQQASKPNEQAQAARNQMENYISKYSKFKSNS